MDHIIWFLIWYFVIWGKHIGFQQTYKAANDIETSQTKHNYKLFRFQRSIYLYKNITYFFNEIY